MKDFNMKLKGFPRVKLILFFICFAFAGFFAGAEKYVLGGANGWSQVSVKNGVKLGTGRYGYDCLELASNDFTQNELTDLLINFEDGTAKDTTGNYTVLSNNLYMYGKAKMGNGCALSRNNDIGLELQGNSTSLFGQEGPAGSFLIDFWLCPAAAENGEVILDWRSSRNEYGQILYQMINVSVYKNRMMATFANIFDGYIQNNGEVQLVTNKKILPGKWSHHSIAYTEDDGILEYRIDGKLECIKYMTNTGHEGGEIYIAVMGKAASLKVCPSYTGYIDDFRLMRSYVQIEREVQNEIETASTDHTYKIDGGRFETLPIMTKTGSILNYVNAEISTPSQTEVQLYVRSGDNFFNWSDDYPKWQPVIPGQKIENISGLYFQIAGDLYPDGAGVHTPSVTEIVLDYTVLPDPLPPFKVSAQKGDGEVTLTWSSSVDDTAGGYYIYYGNRPGEYLGRTAVEGESPIKVGSVTSYTLTGLKNGTIYYFAISTYSKLDNRICGSLSKEVFARPAAK
ncbi:MAG: fibronectin type III domain-containing protein [Treponema sp.]|nr:fibronectin type III domain-containing protein [Treponema sp.]